MLAFIKFRSNVERDFFASLLILIKHLEENGLLSADGRQQAIIEIMRVFSMKNIEAGSSNTRPTETDASVDVVGCARLVLEIAVALPTHYWAGLGQHQACLNDNLFDPASEPAHSLWRKTLAYLEAELTKPRSTERIIEVGTRLEAQFGGRRAFFPATVIHVHEGGNFFDLKYDSTFAQSNKAAGANKGGTGVGRSGGGGGGGGGVNNSVKDAGFSSSVLDNGEIERRVPLSLIRRFPETPRSPREDELMRVINHLKRILRLGIERPVELMHHRRHYMPSIKPTYVPEMPPGTSAVLWMKEQPVRVRGLFDVNRTDSLLFNGEFGWPDRGQAAEEGEAYTEEDYDEYSY
jgi:hypothetical protein